MEGKHVSDMRFSHYWHCAKGLVPVKISKVFFWQITKLTKSSSGIGFFFTFSLFFQTWRGIWFVSFLFFRWYTSLNNRYFIQSTSLSTHAISVNMTLSLFLHRRLTSINNVVVTSRLLFSSYLFFVLLTCAPNSGFESVNLCKRYKSHRLPTILLIH